jgi:hypothetical protein
LAREFTKNNPFSIPAFLKYEGYLSKHFEEKTGK